MPLPTGAWQPGSAYLAYPLLERELLRRPGGKSGKICVEEGHRWLVLPDASLRAPAVTDAPKDDGTPAGEIPRVHVFLCSVCRMSVRIETGRALGSLDHPSQSDASAPSHHFHGAKTNTEFPDINSAGAANYLMTGPETRSFACCLHDTKSIKGEAGAVVVTFTASPPRLPREVMSKLLSGSDIQKKNVLRAVSTVVGDVIKGTPKPLKVWADSTENARKEKSRWFSFVEWNESMNGLGSQLLKAISFIPEPAVNPSVFTAPTNHSRFDLTMILAELRTHLAEIDATTLPGPLPVKPGVAEPEFDRLVLEDLVPLGSGTTLLEKAIGYFPYTKRSAMNNPIAIGSFGGVGYAEYKSSKPAPAFGLLGCHDDMPDAIILDAYKLQVKDDPNMREWYFSALQDIAQGRSSTELHQFCNAELQKGFATIAQLSGALVKFQLSDPIPQLGRNIVDLIPEHAARLNLLKKTLDVNMIIDMATVATCEVGIKDSERDKIRSAVKTIARWLGPKRGRPMATTFGLETELGFSADDDAITIRSDATLASEGSAKTVQDDDMADIPALIGGSPQLPSRGVGFPVGLVNIAQTCYLNSLLQYWFTLRPVRDEVLRRAVASSAPENADDARAAKFVGMLRDLFKGMIWSDGDAVRPERELAELALTPKSTALASAGATKEEPELGSRESAAHAGDGGLVGVEMKTEPEATPSAESSKDADVEMGEAEDAENRDPNVKTGKEDAKTEEADEDKKGEMSPPPIGDLQLSAPSSAMPPSERKGKEKVQEHTDAMDVVEIVAPKPMNVHKSFEGVTSLLLVGTEMPGLEGSTATVAAPTPSPAPKPAPTKMTLGQQQDLTECLDNVMDMLETALKSRKRKREDSRDEAVREREGSEGQAENTIKTLFYGLQRQHLTYTPANATEPTTTTKDEEFSHFLINPRPEIRSSLDETFETTHVTFEGTEAEKEHGLLKAPPVLTLVVNRVQYNRDLQRPFKDQTFMRFTDTLQLARYSNANLVRAKEVRKKEAELKVELKALEEKLAAAKKGEMGEGAPVTDVQTLLNESLDYLMSDPFDMGTATAATPTLADHVSDVVTMITEEQSRVTSAVGDIEMEIGRKKLELEKVWIEVDTADGANEHDYTLHAVFMHRGEATYGHYWIYMRDPKDGRWYKYNDSSVSLIPESEVFKSPDDRTDPTANAYCLVYVRSADLLRLVNVKARDDATRAEYAEAAVEPEATEAAIVPVPDVIPTEEM